MENRQSGITPEFICCNLCGQDITKILYRFDHQTVLSPETAGLDVSSVDVFPSIVKCRKCGLVYVNPRWTFAAGIMPYSQEAEEVYFEQTRQKRIIAYNHLVRHVQNMIPDQMIHAIDVGCGDGLLLRQCIQAGIDCDGFEVSESLVSELQREFGRQKIFTGELGLLSEQSYDCVFLINVIEHLSDPKFAIQQIFHLLKPGGLVFIHAPNMGGLPAMLRGADWHQIEPLGHLYYFSWKTLGRMMAAVGFISEGGFYLKSASALKSTVQFVLDRLHLHLDNGLGMIARRPTER